MVAADVSPRQFPHVIATPLLLQIEKFAPTDVGGYEGRSRLSSKQKRPDYEDEDEDEDENAVNARQTQPRWGRGEEELG